NRTIPSGLRAIRAWSAAARRSENNIVCVVAVSEVDCCGVRRSAESIIANATSLEPLFYSAEDYSGAASFSLTSGELLISTALVSSQEYQLGQLQYYFRIHNASSMHH